MNASRPDLSGPVVVRLHLEGGEKIEEEEHGWVWQKLQQKADIREVCWWTRPESVDFLWWCLKLTSWVSVQAWWIIAFLCEMEGTQIQKGGKTLFVSCLKTFLSVPARSGTDKFEASGNWTGRIEDLGLSAPSSARVCLRRHRLLLCDVWKKKHSSPGKWSLLHAVRGTQQPDV